MRASFEYRPRMSIFLQVDRDRNDGHKALGLSVTLDIHLDALPAFFAFDVLTPALWLSFLRIRTNDAAPYVPIWAIVLYGGVERRRAILDPSP